MRTQWTDVLIERLTRLWADGYSGTEIAKMLPVDLSRQAVLGKLDRLGLLKTRGQERVRKTPAAPRTSQAEAKPKPKPKTRVGRAPNVIEGRQGVQKGTCTVTLDSAVKQALTAAAVINPEARRVPLEALGRNECRYAVNDAPKGGVHLFCGAPTAPARSYCEQHHARCLYPAPQKRKRAAVVQTTADILDMLERLRRGRA